MNSASKRHDAVGVPQAEQSTQLVRRHAAFQAVPDARPTQAGCGEHLRESKDSTTASEFVVEDGTIEAPTSTGHENEVFGSSSCHPVEVTVDDRFGSSREINLTPIWRACPATGKTDDSSPVRALDVMKLKQANLGRKAAGPIKQGQCGVELDSLGILKIERDQTQAVGSSRKYGHTSENLNSSHARYGRPSCAQAWADVPKCRRSANHATGPPRRTWPRSEDV
jgi:hypothetical protein